MCCTACVSSHRRPKASLPACLGVGDVMDGSDAAVLDAQLLMDHLQGGSWAKQVWVGAEGQAPLTLSEAVFRQLRAARPFKTVTWADGTGSSAASRNSGSAGGRTGAAQAGSHAKLPAHLHYRGQAVGGAGRSCDDVVVGCVVQVLRAGMEQGSSAGRSELGPTANAADMQAPRELASRLLLEAGGGSCVQRHGCSQCALLTWFTPYTMFSTGCGSFTGADTTTFLQPCTGA